MLDTLVLRFHGILSTKTTTLAILKTSTVNTTNFVVDEHYQLFKKMLKYKGRFFSTVSTRTKTTETREIIDEDDFLQLESKNNIHGLTAVKQVMRFTDEKVVKEVNQKLNGKYRVPSSVSDVVFSINEDANYIDFNISIPKYLYGHSLAEFIPQISSELYFKYNDLMSIKRQRKLLFPRLNAFIDVFLNDLAHMFHLDTLPNRNYIELRRLDLCYNQYFDHKNDSLLYLENQKKLLKKKATFGNAKIDSYNTSLTYFTSKGAYFKIYHKGSEYAKSNGDLKKHTRINMDYVEAYLNNNNAQRNHIKETIKDRRLINQLFERIASEKELKIDDKFKPELNRQGKILKKINPFDTVFLKKEMDKVLRYEISLRGDFFSYQYKTKLFRKDCRTWKKYVDIYKQINSKENSVDLKKRLNISKKDRSIAKEVDAFFKRSISFVLSDNRPLHQSQITTDDSYFDDNVFFIPLYEYRYTNLSEKDLAPFTDDFLQICIDRFFEIVKGFQVKSIETFDDVRKKIDDYNEQVERNVIEYNNLNTWRLVSKDNLFSNEKRIIKGNRIITKPVQLLTDTEKQKLGLKKIRKQRLLQILREMEAKKSLPVIRKELGIHKSTFSRLLRDLKMFGVYEQTLQVEKIINPRLDYHQYYFNTNGISYQNKFYVKQKHKIYD
ncbi:MAG: hypothetical protein Wins2KO_04250 [Winogradskyella sp.]